MILSRPLLHAQQRFNLEDLNALLAAGRTDSLLYTKHFLSSQNYVLQGFTISGIGLKQATVNMTDATLIIPQSSVDFSWFTSAPSEPAIVIPEGSITPGVRNYVEVQLTTQNNTLITAAFWDPSANAGAGAEFSQIVNTITDLEVVFNVLVGGFSGSPDSLPLCIMDVDGSNNIKTILDRRNLFYRLAIPTNLDNNYPWGTKLEPPYALNMTSVSGIFMAGETITINTESATVTTGGTTSISFNAPTGINFFPGSTVTGLTSGATGTVNTVLESFSGVDKSIVNNKNMFDSLMTEFKALKGTRFWWSSVGMSISSIAQAVNSLIVSNKFANAPKFSWNGSALSITDGNLSTLNSDVLGNVILLSQGSALNLQRADGQASTSTIPIGDGQVLFVQLPTSGNRNYSGNGSGATNYQVVNQSSFVVADDNYWLAYRSGSVLYIRGQSELSIGENAPIGDDIPGTLLANIGLIDEVTPASYSATSSGSLNLPNYNTTPNESLVSRLAKLTAMLADVRQDLNIELDPGTIVWDGTNITVTGAQLSIPGTTVGSSPVSINTFASAALAVNSCLYVDISRTSGSALTLATSTLAALTPSQQRLVIARNIGGNILVR